MLLLNTLLIISVAFCIIYYTILYSSIKLL